MINPAVRNENIKKLRELIGDIRIAMLTTVDPDTQRLYTRPMSMQRRDFDGNLWFFTLLQDDKVDDIQHVPDVVISLVDEGRNLYISLTGTAKIERDLELMEELWHNDLKSWFPKGLDDPNLGLIKVEVDHAQYWDGPDNAVERVVGMVKAVSARESYVATENDQLNLA